MYDVIALDIDGTLLRSDSTISYRTEQVLKEQFDRGKKIVIATARPLRQVNRILPKWLKNCIKIVYNGAEIYEGSKKIYSRYISIDSLKHIHSQLYSLSQTTRIALEINNQLIANFCIEELFGNVIYESVDFTKYEWQPAAKMMINFDDNFPRDYLKQNIPEQCHIVITDNNTLGQVMHRNVSKLNGIMQILDITGTSLDRVLAFGDDHNDIEIIKNCGLGVAMGNAVNELKLVAGYVTKDNDSDGIAYFINNIDKLIT